MMGTGTLQAICSGRFIIRLFNVIVVMALCAGCVSLGQRQEIIRVEGKGIPEGLRQLLALTPPDPGWSDREIRAMGRGEPSGASTSIAQRRLTALNTAKRNALRDIAGQVMRVKVNQDTTVWNYVSLSETAAAQVNSIIDTAYIEETMNLDDDAAEVKLVLDMKPVGEIVQKVHDERIARVKADLEARQANLQEEARNAAILDAYELLLTLMQGLQVKNGVTIEDLMFINKSTRDKVMEIIHTAKTAGIHYHADGTCTAVLEFDVQHMRRSVEF